MPKDLFLILTTPPRRMTERAAANAPRRKKRLTKLSRQTGESSLGEVRRVLNFEAMVEPPASQPAWRQNFASSFMREPDARPQLFQLLR